MRHPYLLTCVILCIMVNVQAQEMSRYVIPNAGDEIGNTVSYTFGQAVVGSQQSNQIQISQGYQDNDNSQTVGIIEYSQLESVNIYPNPVPERLHVEFQAQRKISGQLHLRSLLGLLIKSIDFRNEDQFTTSIRVDQLPEGFYTLSLIDKAENVLAIQKLLIQH